MNWPFVRPIFFFLAPKELLCVLRCEAYQPFFEVFSAYQSSVRSAGVCRSLEPRRYLGILAMWREMQRWDSEQCDFSLPLIWQYGRKERTLV